MKVAKLKEQKKEIKQKDILVQDEYSIKKILITLGIVLLVFVAFYFITMLVIKPSTSSKEKYDYPVEFNFDLITINHLLDRKESEYYVLASKSDSKVNYNEIYNNYLSKYKTEEDSFKIYKVDLSDSFNNNYIGETNITDNLSELKINEDVLFKIKDGKIEQYFVGSSNILATLSEL